MNKDAKIFVAGHRGLVGSAIVRALEKEGYKNLVLKTRDELDLTDQRAVAEFFAREKPEYVFLAAAKVGGIMANKTSPADFIHENIMIQTNVIHNACTHKVKKLLFLGSSSIYPRQCPQPIKEDYLMTGELESSNKAYAVAKIAGITMCQAYNEQYGTNFISVMPTNLYGEGDSFDLDKAHVLPAILRKLHEAKREGRPSVELFGTGTARREFLHVDDLADACIFLMERYDDSNIVNIGTGEDITISELAEKIERLTRFNGTILWDSSKPDGTEQKLLDVSKIHALGWSHSVSLDEGITSLYDWYTKHHE